jgi:pSer/pThr/pTyr-binding forkhead associated (FHA) protein
MTSHTLDHPTTARTLIAASGEGRTERVDAVACLDERARRQASAAAPTEPGRYIEVLGEQESLLIRLGDGVTHIGRGLTADLRLDENSVSRRHAMLVDRPGGARVLDDRSSNGTLLNGRRVVQADLHDGDVLVLGRAVLRYLEV